VTFLGATLTVLEANGRSMTAREILSGAMERGLLASAGKTPDATLTALLYTYVRNHPDGPLVRIAEPGPSRARRGSVRWALRESDVPRQGSRSSARRRPRG
jgi:hypothetical protein